MKPATRNIVLAVILGAEVALTFALNPDYARPNVEFLPDMAHQPRANAFAENPYLPNRSTLQVPPPGTIPRGLLPEPYGPSPEEARRAGGELSLPIPEKERAGAVRRGKELYGRFCVPCHGAAGGGDGLVALRGFPPPPSLAVAHAIDLTDGQIFHILSHGQGNMPSYASQIDREDRWRVVLYVRSMQEKELEKAGQQAAAPATGAEEQARQQPEKEGKP